MKHLTPFRLLLAAGLATTLFGIGIIAVGAPQASESAINPGTINACAGKPFVNVSAHPKNSAYPAPALAVSCDGKTMTVAGNGIPNFEFVAASPNPLRAQNYRFHIPQRPTKAAAVTAVPLGGPIGVAADGLPIFGPTEAPQDDYGDPYLDRMLDFCNGHTAPGGDYHFHARPDCIGVDAAKPGALLGYAFDGFPILSPVVCGDAACKNTTRLRSSWKLTSPGLRNAWKKHSYAAGSGDLDQCNGKTQPDGSYAYYATDSFPYFLGCYTGTPTANRGAAGGPRGAVDGQMMSHSGHAHAAP